MYIYVYYVDSMKKLDNSYTVVFTVYNILPTQFIILSSKMLDLGLVIAKAKSIQKSSLLWLHLVEI